MNQPEPKLPANIETSVIYALEEDVGEGDITAKLIPPQTRGSATVVSREQAVVCGIPWFDRVFLQLDPSVQTQWHVEEGQTVDADTVLCTLEGTARGLLTGERTALNFMQLLSGTATIARRYANAVADSGCQVLDTRKTIPGLRAAQKYAAAVGGVTNHRTGLFDGILIKENHLMAAGGIDRAVKTARAMGHQLPVEVEVETLEECRQALGAGADILLLDNFTLEELRAAVDLNRDREPRALLEASGNISIDRLSDIAATGVDFVSVGAITKHVRAIDLSMRFVFESIA
ncbi:MAG: carboxylating nicotinate-nucleotide diphosphorylase [Gammaproteobacteria bacterium]|nr:MAG: carboxylating nicotinate-nucleotide diphosphorylase [Gammaproteobacteria bacterium]